MPPKDQKTKLQQYEEFQAMVRKDIESMFPALYQKEATKYGVAKVPLHEHNGLDSPKIPAGNIVNPLRASGSIRLATDGQRYTLQLTGTPSQVLFYGNAVHLDGGGNPDIRAFVIGSAELGQSYFFAPVDTSSVAPSDYVTNVIQSCSSIVMPESALTDFRAVASEGHIVRVAYPTTGTIVASATIPNEFFDGGQGLTTRGYGQGFVYLDVELADGWEINGNFVVT